jgi:hypothetical protein
MSKKVNFVFDWIGPINPIPNNSPPNVYDMARASGRTHFKRVGNELQFELQTSNCYEFLQKSELVRTYPICDLPNETFLYEYNHYWWHSIEEFFGSGKLGGMLGWSQLPANVFNRIKNKTAYLLVTCPLESILKDSDLMQIENYFRNSGLPMSQVIYLTCSPNCQEVYDSYCQRFSKPNEGLQFEYLPFYFYIYKDILQNKEVKYTIGKKSKTFLMFNRRWGSQAHRVLILAYLYKNNLLEHFNISFSKLEIDNGGTYTNHARQFFNRLSTRNIISDEDLAGIEAQLPLILDTPDHKLNLMFDEFDSTRQLYENSFVNIIAETNFFTNIVHLTEKSYKPIAYKQPFIMFATSGSLKAMREQGFVTFNSIWDESYDLETDDTQRFFKVLELIKEIASWSDEKKLEASIKIKTIVDFNFRVLQTAKVQSVINFRKKYGT